MKNIEIGRYDNPESVGFVGWIDATSFVVFVRADGTYFMHDR